MKRINREVHVQVEFYEEQHAPHAFLEDCNETKLKFYITNTIKMQGKKQKPVIPERQMKALPWQTGWQRDDWLRIYSQLSCARHAVLSDVTSFSGSRYASFVRLCLLISKYNGKVIACDFMLFSAHHNRTALLQRANTYFMIRKEKPKPSGKTLWNKIKKKKLTCYSNFFCNILLLKCLRLSRNKKV